VLYRGGCRLSGATLRRTPCECDSVTVTHLEPVNAGTFLAIGAQLSVKYASFRVLEQLFAWVPLEVRRMWQPPVHSLVDDKLARAGIPVNDRGQPWDVSLGARFLSYTALAWAVATAPAAFRAVAGFAGGQA
jgi:hypothetical protein